MSRLLSALHLFIEEGHRVWSPSRPPISNDAVCVESDVSWKGRNFEEIRDLVHRIEILRPHHLVLFDIVAPSLLVRLVDCDTNNDARFGRMFLRVFHQTWRRLPTRRAPGPPEIHQNDLASQVFKSDKLAI